MRHAGLTALVACLLCGCKDERAANPPSVATPPTTATVPTARPATVPASFATRMRNPQHDAYTSYREWCYPTVSVLTGIKAQLELDGRVPRDLTMKRLHDVVGGYVPAWRAQLTADELRHPSAEKLREAGEALGRVAKVLPGLIPGMRAKEKGEPPPSGFEAAEQEMRRDLERAGAATTEALRLLQTREGTVPFSPL